MVSCLGLIRAKTEQQKEKEEEDQDEKGINELY